MATTGQVTIMERMAITLAAAALLAGCATPPVTETVTLGSGIPATARTFTIVLPADELSKTAMPIVEERLRQHGYEASLNGDLLLEVSAAERSRAVGAFVPGCDSAPEWTDAPDRKWLIGGGEVTTLRVRLIEAATSAPVYQSSASLRTSGRARAAANAPKLVAAALASDPRGAARRTQPAC